MTTGITQGFSTDQIIPWEKLPDSTTAGTLYISLCGLLGETGPRPDGGEVCPLIPLFKLLLSPGVSAHNLHKSASAKNELIDVRYRTGFPAPPDAAQLGYFLGKWTTISGLCRRCEKRVQASTDIFVNLTRSEGCTPQTKELIHTSASCCFVYSTRNGYVRLEQILKFPLSRPATKRFLSAQPCSTMP